MAVLRTNDVVALTGLSRTTIWRREREGGFPKRIRLSPRCVGWDADEINAWIAARPKGLAGAS